MLCRHLVIVVLLILMFESAISFVSKPLILTPYLTAGKIKTAQEMCRVSPDMNGVKSYSGFFNINQDCGNNLFFWFFPAENNWEKAPVLLWLAGEAAASALIGMFMDIGPFNHNRKKGFVNREYYWTKDNNVLFLDQPVGNGFSYTEKGCYPDTPEKLSKDVYEALIQFFTLFPRLQQNKFFIVGQSFAAHYGPVIATEIHHCNKYASKKINLAGLVIGDPYIDLRCHNFSSYEYELGIIDEKTRDLYIKNDKVIYSLIDDEKYIEAADIINNPPLYDNGIASYDNILDDYPKGADFEVFIRDYKVRNQIHVGTTPYITFSYSTVKYLRAFLYTPTNSHIEELLKAGEYIVGFYSGQLDEYNPNTAVPCVLRQLQWHGVEEYKAANRSKWYVDKQLAGWLKVADNLFEVVIRNSGLYTMRDQPRATYELVSTILAGCPATKLLSKLQTEPLSYA